MMEEPMNLCPIMHSIHTSSSNPAFGFRGSASTVLVRGNRAVSAGAREPIFVRC